MQATRGLALISSKRNPSFSDSNKVFCNISNAIRGSNIQWRGRAFAASVPSDSSKSVRRPKRVSKNERRAMVESFVDRYRASNEGKYPPTKTVQKEVGGGYYVIKRILEEVEYQSKVSTTSGASDEPEAKEKTLVSSSVEKPVIEEAVISTTNGYDSSCTQKYTGIEKPVDSGLETAKSERSLDSDGQKEEMQEAGQESLESDKIARDIPGEKQVDSGIETSKYEGSLNAEALESDKIARDIPEEKPVDSGIETAKYEGSLDLDGSKEEMQEAGKKALESDKIARDIPGEKPVDSGIETATFEGSLDLDSPKEETQEAGQESLESDKIGRDIPGEETKEDAVSKRSTLWGNLRSFADGVMKFWRSN